MVDSSKGYEIRKLDFFLPCLYLCLNANLSVKIDTRMVAQTMIYGAGLVDYHGCISHEPSSKGEDHILPHSCRTWLQEAAIGSVFLMKPKGDDHTPPRKRT